MMELTEMFVFLLVDNTVSCKLYTVMFRV